MPIFPASPSADSFVSGWAGFRLDWPLLCRYTPLSFRIGKPGVSQGAHGHAKDWDLAFVAGCVTTSGFDRGALHESFLTRSQNEAQVTDAEVKKALELRPQLNFPCKIAIYLFDPGNGYQWRWGPRDKELILTWMNTLKKEGIVADAFFMSGMFTSGNSLKELRLAAAQHGADAVLLLKGAYQTDNYLNAAAVLNLTVVGGFLAPASHCDTLFLVQGGLIDVANGYLYATAESEGEAGIIRPTFIIEEKDAVEQAKKKAIDSLGPELVRRLRNLDGKMDRPAPAARLAAPFPGP